MRILLLSQFFTPEPVFKALPFAKGLARLGHTVEVLTGVPNYPGGRVYPGYRVRPWQRECLDGIPVTRVGLYPSHDRSAIGRTLNYTTFALSASILGPFLTHKPDVVYVYHPPATVGLPACVLKMFKGVPFVYDIMDLWPDTISATGMLSNTAVLDMLHHWCSFVYRCADHLTVLSPGFQRALVERGVPRNKISVIYNWADEENIYPVERDEELAQSLGLNGRFNVIFAGTLGLAQALDAVLDAAELCASVNPAIQFVFVGEGVEKSRLKSRAAGRPNILFIPLQPIREMSRILGLADALLVHLKDDPLFRITIPSKTQASLAAAKPVLMAASGDAADIVKRANAGICAQPENAAEIADAALQLARMGPEHLREMGSRGRSLYLREMSIDVGVRRFEDLFLALTGRTPTPDFSTSSISTAIPTSEPNRTTRGAYVQR